MSTSGQYSFDPALGELTIFAFNLCGLRPTGLTQEHYVSARMAANLLLGRLSSMPGVNTWAVDLQTVALIQGQATYTVPSNTVAMLDAYITISGNSATQDRILMPVSRSEYASYPNKEQEGFPTVFWFDRLLSPTVTLYQVPDGNEATFSYYRMRQLQDANFTSGQQVELPYYWYELFALGLAQRLAMIWAPDKAGGLKMMFDEAYDIAADQNTETAQFYLSPQLSSYYR